MTAYRTQHHTPSKNISYHLSFKHPHPILSFVLNLSCVPGFGSSIDSIGIIEMN